MDRLLQYKEVEEYILGIPKFTKKNSPEATAEFWEYLGRPGEKQKLIHIAGTNGKGSVCAYLRSLLEESGYSTGMFTSPHLVSMTERIMLMGQPVAENDFVDAFHAVMEKAEEKAGYHPTFFEILFFMAMVIFEKKEPDYLILETGLGGRLDATNCIKSPIMTVITRIGKDHMEYLGDTIEKIAAEKAGIIKEGVPLICLREPSEAYRVLANEAEKKAASVFAVDKEEALNLKIHKKSIDFSYKSRYYGYVSLTLSTGAVYQVENALLALKAFEHLLLEQEISEEVLQLGMSKAVWEGRMEEVLPEVYIDGAHNEDGVRAFLETVRMDGCRGKRELLFSVVKDKEYESMLKEIIASGLFRKIAVAPLATERTADTEELLSVIEACGNTECESYNGIQAAFSTLIKNRGASDRIYAAGSLYLVGQIKTLLRRNVYD